MAISRLILLALALLPACMAPTYQRIETGPLTRAQVWNGVTEVAGSGGFPADLAGTDQGLGIYESRWLTRVLRMGHSGRSRLRVELEPHPEGTWTVRYYVEQQEVDDLTRSLNPQASDWRDDGQNAQEEEIFGVRLRMRLGLDLGPTEDRVRQTPR